MGTVACVYQTQMDQSRARFADSLRIIWRVDRFARAIRTMPASRAAAGPALQVVRSREHNVWTLVVVILGIERRRNLWRTNFVITVHVSIVSCATRSEWAQRFNRYNQVMEVSAKAAAQARARKIKVILFDVDGVLTDGGIWLIPVPVEIDGRPSTKMVEAKGYNAHDGTAISLARLGGLKCGIITKRISETVALRARDLKLEFVYQGQAFKMKPIREIMEKDGVTLDEICYVGDDVIDLPVMRKCGFAVAVADARERVKAEAHYVTPNRGGHGAARDAVEFILEAKGVLDQCIEAYIDEDNPISPSMDIGKGGDLK